MAHIGKAPKTLKVNQMNPFAFTQPGAQHYSVSNLNGSVITSKRTKALHDQVGDALVALHEAVDDFNEALARQENADVTWANDLRDAALAGRDLTKVERPAEVDLDALRVVTEARIAAIQTQGRTAVVALAEALAEEAPEQHTAAIEALDVQELRVTEALSALREEFATLGLRIKQASFWGSLIEDPNTVPNHDLNPGLPGGIGQELARVQSEVPSILRPVRIAAAYIAAAPDDPSPEVLRAIPA